MSKRGKDSICPSRFLLDLFMFSTLMEGISCHSNQNPTNELKIFNGKHQMENFGRFCRFCSRFENQTFQNENHPEGGNFVFDKMLHWIFDEKEMEKGTENRKRSFQMEKSRGRRLRLAILPIMYKMGVMTTMLTGLMVLAAKGLAVGLMLLMFAFGNHFFKHGKDSNQSYQQPPIHVHVHSDGHQSGHYVEYKHPESEVSIDPWDRKEVEDKYLKPKNEISWQSYQR